MDKEDRDALRVWAQDIINQRDDQWPANRIAHSVMSALDQLDSQDAVIHDYEAWLDMALDALGVKTVFDIPKPARVADQ